MSVTSVEKDYENLSLLLVADFTAPTDRVWELWADPRQLERWWGPPTYPATMEEHDLTAGGRVTYFMTSPEGEKFHGWWEIVAVTPKTSLELVDGFGDKDGNPDESLPKTTMRMRLVEHDGGTRMELTSRFASREQMDQLVQMQMVEGLTESVGQIDALLAESAVSH